MKIHYFLGILCALCLTACPSAQIRTDIQKALVYETSWQNDFEALVNAANDMIPTLPPEQQQAAHDKVEKYRARGLEFFQTKEATLEAALEASETTVNITQFAIDVAKILGELIGFAQTMKVSNDIIQPAALRFARLQVNINRGAFR